MNPTRFDRVSKLFAERRLSRRSAVVHGGIGLVLATGLTDAAAQEATPQPEPIGGSDSAGREFLFVQSFQQGALSQKQTTGSTPVAGMGDYVLTLSEGLGQTIFFSDRPDRIVGAVPTPRFLNALGFTPDNPPNAALVASTSDGNEEILIVELFNPTYDESTKTATYEVRILDDAERVDMQFSEIPNTGDHADTTYAASHLFVDDCDDGFVRCYNNMFQEKLLGDIAVHRCWVWSELCCFPCSTGNDFDKMAQLCKEVYGDQCDPVQGCSAGNLGGCG